MRSIHHFILYCVFNFGSILLIEADMKYLGHDYGHSNQWWLALIGCVGGLWHAQISMWKYNDELNNTIGK